MMNMFALLLVIVTDFSAVSGDGTDQTVNLQAAMNAAAVGETVDFAKGTYRINPGVGLKITKAMTLDLRGSTLYIYANVAPKSRGIETVPGVSGVTILGGTLRGSLAVVPSLQWSIGLRIDSAKDVLIDGTTFQDWYTDGVWVGGNAPSERIRFTGLLTERCRRNGLSIVNAQAVRVERSAFNGTSGDPGAGVDVEPNAGDQVTDFSIYDSTFENNQKGLYMHKGKGIGGENYKVINCTMRGSLQYGLAANSITKLLIANTRVEANPPSADVGMSFGGDFEVILAFNYARGRNHDFRYSGMGNMSTHGNDGRITVVAPWFLGRVSIQ